MKTNKVHAFYKILFYRILYIFTYTYSIASTPEVCLPLESPLFMQKKILLDEGNIF